MRYPRCSGILLHPTSLPGRYGIGDLGPEAYRFLDLLHDTQQSIWQVLPLGPTGYGDSPYQCFSAFAGTPLLISPDLLVEQGHLTPADVSAAPTFPAGQVDYGAVIEYKAGLLRRAFESFRSRPGCIEQAEFSAFCASKRGWLDDYALFMSLKDAHQGAAWTSWEPELVTRQPRALDEQARALANDIEYHKYLQYQFFKQWLALKGHAAAHGIRIVGDIPIFVAHDSADVWAHPQLFHLDSEGKPTVVAGVPPDYFSETGQLWGNPLYRWDRMCETGFAWWIERFRSLFELVDIARLDHFRGFEAYWEVPASEKTAVRGQWVKAPGQALFEAVEKALGSLPIWAEDLGVITPGVVELREHFGFPGMRIFQFGFASDAADPFLPHNYVSHCVAYTGSHDNDTARGWFNTCTPKERDAVLTYFGTDGSDISWDFVRWLLASVADTTITPLQDILSLGTEARMNYPSRLGGNWGWRFGAAAVTPDIRERLRVLTAAYGRAPTPRIAA